jgi:hypothetical protein
VRRVADRRRRDSHQGSPRPLPSCPPAAVQVPIGVEDVDLRDETVQQQPPGLTTPLSVAVAWHKRGLGKLMASWCAGSTSTTSGRGYARPCCWLGGATQDSSLASGRLILTTYHRPIPGSCPRSVSMPDGLRHHVIRDAQQRPPRVIRDSSVPGHVGLPPTDRQAQTGSGRCTYICKYLV